jgi:hypothetical protein
MFRMAEALHGLMGFGVEPLELKKQPCANCKLEVGCRLCSACRRLLVAKFKAVGGDGGRCQSSLRGNGEHSRTEGKL